MTAGRRMEEGGVVWWLGEDLSAERARPLLRRALAELAAGAPNEKQGRRKELYRLHLAGGEAPDHLLKVNRYPGGLRLRSKARRELELSRAVAARGLPTPVPVAAGERRAGGRLEACFLLVPVLPGVVDLRRRWREAREPAERRALARALGDLARRLHDAGIHQDDFQPNNFLVRPGADGQPPELWVIDFERARRRRCVPARLRRRALAKLDREMGRAPRTARMRFLHAYAGDGARSWWRAVAHAAPALARRDAARLRRNAVRPGRRARRLRLPGWAGLAAPDVPDARVAGALAEAGNAPGRIHGDPAGDAWSVVLAGSGVRAARDAWARAWMLFDRELVPRPLAVACGARTAVLLLERTPRAVTLGELRPNETVAAARRVLEGRLRGYGRLRGGLAPDGVAVVPAGAGRAAAWLLDVERFGVRPRFSVGPRFGVRPRFGGRGGSAAPAR